MSFDKATKRPWVLRGMSYGYDMCLPGFKGDGSGGWFLELHHGPIGRNPDEDEEVLAGFHANAALIVHAVNSYDANLKRIAELEAALKPFAELFKEGFSTKYDEKKPDSFRVFYNMTMGDLRRARAALAKGEG